MTTGVKWATGMGLLGASCLSRVCQANKEVVEPSMSSVSAPPAQLNEFFESTHCDKEWKGFKFFPKLVCTWLRHGQRKL